MTQSRHIRKGRGMKMTRKRRLVWSLLARGFTNPEIGEAVDAAMGTVKCHVDDVYKIIGARNRVEAALLFHGIDPRARAEK
jgi:DNA-binding NarL/FixJ family response regulator